MLQEKLAVIRIAPILQSLIYNMKSLILTVKTWNSLLLCLNYVSLTFRAIPQILRLRKIKVFQGVKFFLPDP
jgi:hypothetical protein